MVTAIKRTCVECKRVHCSSEANCYECRKRKEIRSEIEGLSKEELLESLKNLFAESEREQMNQLMMVFSIGNKYLTSDFILDALFYKIQSEFEENEVDEHMLQDAKRAYKLLSVLHKNWYGW